jgi:hypothetical protein
MLPITLAAAMFSIFMDMISRADRQDLHRQQAVNREMLDARARIQINAFNAILQQRSFSSEELREMDRLWKAAQYDLIQQRFLSDGKSESQN